ncbi:MAG TPA: hypothetical protein VIH61_03205 [Waddliaceae bacterium]
MNERKTLGSQVEPLLNKEPESRDPIELQREMQKEYHSNLIQCINDFKKNNHSDFFVVVITKNEKLLPNVFRNYFFARKTCPTPDYDQSVFHYKHDIECAEYVWTVPSRDACIYLRDNAALVSPEERQLLGFVLDFSDGYLYSLCKKLNRECKESNHIIKK